MKITVITPSYNLSQYLERSIDSVLLQNYPNLEYMIIDGGSTDGSIDIIKKNEKHLSYWVSETDNGQSYAINKGLKLASGDIINWINSDDYYEPDILEKVSMAFNEGVNAVGGRSRIFDQNGTKHYSNGTDIYPGNISKTLGWARIDQPETFFRKKVWNKVGPLNTDLHYVFDREWWIRYLLLYGLDGFKKTPDVLVNFRHHASSKTISKKKEFEKESLHLYAAYAKHANMDKNARLLYELSGSDPKFYIDIPSETDKDLFRSMINYHFLLLGNTYYTNDMKKEAIRLY